MSRLNLQYTVLSKRKLIKLVDKKYVRGWDDPRMPTISGLRRRGYTKEIINTFCNDIGATRAKNIVEISKLYQTARLHFAPTARRVMAAINPIKVTITNFAEEKAKSETMTFDVQNSPTDESLGRHTVTLTEVIYLDATDFRLQDEPQYYGLAPGKAVGLKYQGGNMICDQVIQTNGKVTELKCHLETSDDRPKPKAFISWVPSDSIKSEVRIYNNLFTVAEPTDLWEDELNPESEIVYENALVDPSISEAVDYRSIDKWSSNVVVQFERFGYFVVDYDTTYDTEKNEGLLVFNRSVSLKEESFKKKLTAEEEAKLAARKAQQEKDLASKEKRMTIDPKDFFREADEYKGKFSKYDDEGIPTHDAEGNELTKSMNKKLVKELQKHKKQQAAWQKNPNHSN